MRRRLSALSALTMTLVLVPAGVASAHEEDGPAPAAATAAQLNDPPTTATGGMTHVANVPYVKGDGTTPTSPGGSDVEFITTGGKDYAFAGTTGRNGLQIIDITNPLAPVRVTTYDCPISQGDVQVFRQGSRILLTYTADSTLGAAGATSACAKELGLTSAFIGTVLVDVTNPAAPVAVSKIDITTGSHNMTVHPSGNFLYNSNSDLITDQTPQIEIIDITNAAVPVRLPDFPFPVNETSLGSNSHDITFNPAGTRGYSAALSSTLVLNTENPAAPKLIAQVEIPRINVEHDIKMITLKKTNGTPRDLLLIGDERGGAAASACPGGGITVLDITGPLESAPKDLGTWYINDFSTITVGPGGTLDGPDTVCTSHVFAVYPEQGLLTIAWYNRGVRVLDIRGLANYEPVSGAAPIQAFGNQAPGIGITEIGSWFAPTSDNWSFKTNRIAANGAFYGFGNDRKRAFDVFLFPGDNRNVAPFGPGDPGADPVIPEVPLALLLPLVGAAAFGLHVARRRGRMSAA